MGIIIRLRSPSGTLRINVPNEDTSYSEFINLISLQLKSSDPFTLFFDQKLKNRLPDLDSDSQNITIKELNLKHGDMIFAQLPPSESTVSGAPSSSSMVYDTINKSSSAVDSKSQTSPTKKELPSQPLLDFELEKHSGSISRGKDSDFCKHGSNAMCEYCMPLEPYDPAYLSENKIKHISFHSYLRKSISNEQREAGLSSGPLPNSVLPLEELSFQAKKDCNGGHAPWPEGICTKCQPSAITLQQQEFRMTDHLEFAEAGIIEKLLTWWRETGTQRFGLMYGTFEKYDIVPLGIEAVVQAIYEPVQTNMLDGIIVEIESEAFLNEIKNVDTVAKACGLELVGIIFTDLTDDGTGQGKVEYKRHKDSYFLTGLECRLAAKFQSMYPNYSRWSQDGTFGSRLVTAIVSGNENSDIEISAWQISNTGVELENSNLVVSSSDPGFMMVRKPQSVSTEKNKNKRDLSLQYIPDILYKYKNEYNVSVLKSAKPFFPIEYLLVSLTYGVPSNPRPMFKSKSPFFTENRHLTQTPESLQSHLSKIGLGSPEVTSYQSAAQGLSDFHLLVYMTSFGILSTDLSTENSDNKSDLYLLGKIVQNGPNQSEKYFNELAESSSWLSLIAVLNSSAGNNTSSKNYANTNQQNSGLNQPHNVSRHTIDESTSSSNSQGSFGESHDMMDVEDSQIWSCRHCTYDNDISTTWCAICGLPKDD
ncbi:hypothetical protein BB560_001887 [Smittium megazygosporum]|uniref:Nuclear protein localization protein 4 n=1 Tax=Smittium megazygosporum TaxID=133381 RepID=A0A2T9ZGA8_9FUNG|nr:hypothetical protein BB560_001887 [Smittium megazygosporum]